MREVQRPHKQLAVADFTLLLLQQRVARRRYQLVRTHPTAVVQLRIVAQQRRRLVQLEATHRLEPRLVQLVQQEA